MRCLGDALLQLAHMRPLYTPRRIGGCVYYGITTTTTPYLPSLILFLHMQKKEKKIHFVPTSQITSRILIISQCYNLVDDC